MPQEAVLTMIIQAIVVVAVVFSGFAGLTVIERKLIGRFQARRGPNRAGPFGLLQPLADIGKLTFKEDFVPAGDGLLVIPCRPVFGDATAHRSDALASVLEPTRVGLAPAEAERLGVRTEARVRISTPHGEAVLPLEVDSRLQEGAAYLFTGDPHAGATALLPMDGGPVCAVVGVAQREQVEA